MVLPVRELWPGYHGEEAAIRHLGINRSMIVTPNVVCNAVGGSHIPDVDLVTGYQVRVHPLASRVGSVAASRLLRCGCEPGGFRRYGREDEPADRG